MIVCLVRSERLHNLVVYRTALVACIFGQPDKRKTYDRILDLLSLHCCLRAPVDSCLKDTFHHIYSMVDIDRVSDFLAAWNSVDLGDRGRGNLAPRIDNIEEVLVGVV